MEGTKLVITSRREPPRSNMAYVNHILDMSDEQGKSVSENGS